MIADSGIIYVHYDATLGHTSLIESDPERYFGSFQGCAAEYWYGPGFLDFSNRWKRIRNSPVEQQDGGDPFAGVYAANIAMASRNAPPNMAGRFHVRDGFRADLEWGPTLAKLREDPPAVICITHFFPADLAQFMVQFAPNPTNSLIYMQYGPMVPRLPRDCRQGIGRGDLCNPGGRSSG
ncbi:hypothetical protein [Gemmobacter sp. 24YEA27]|uniref:hypothetical protein n=1 Tax=Gemmobacter sp. 24YEA27 TaxID=3040672 RepID=UPI0024B39757|nr:hypothetical protein [Gemmobacter sp. 24YEA27]